MGGMYFSTKRRMGGGSRLEKRAKGKSLVAKITKADTTVVARAAFKERDMSGLLRSSWTWTTHQHEDGNSRCQRG